MTEQQTSHNPEVAGSNPAPATAKGARKGAFRFLRVLHGPSQLAPPEDLAGCVEARRAHDASAGVGGGAAQVEALDRRPVPRVAGDGAEREELARGHRALE